VAALWQARGIMTDAHASPDGNRPAPLYDITVPTPTHAERARTLAQQVSVGTLCTLALDPKGHPYGSLVTVAFDAGEPVFLISELAEHTRNLRQDGRASLLVAESVASDPLANARVTLVGQARLVKEAALPEARAAYLSRHPDAAYYADFKDFAFWTLSVESVRYIGGYGRMSWVPAEDWRRAEPDPIAADARGILSHMNEDHAEALALYCRAFSKAEDTSVATMTSVDRYGFEMSAITALGPCPIRLAFSTPITDKTDARKALVALLHEARAKLGSTPK
jgi:heme oxygenase (biliverdin-IX-beta and delta-forming)